MSVVRLHPGRSVLALACIAVAWSMLAQGWGGNQDSHYALVRALASGTPTIDRTRLQVGDVQPPTPDISEYKGHIYSNKAPGFAFATLPAYFAMKAAGKAQPVHDTTGQLWFLGLWGLVVPGFLLLVLVARIADELEPGFGTAAAVTLGVATMILPFSTLFFSHVFSALLVFGAFAFVWHERRGPPRLAWVAVGGLLAGYSITTEFPNAIAAGIVGCYAIARSSPARRALAFGGGAIVGLIPLLLYNQWAFGSPFHLSYQSTVGFGSTSTLFLEAPSFRRAVVVLLAPIGVLRMTPVVVLAVVGIVLLFRRGRRAEALAIGAIAFAYLLFESSYQAPFGGASPGPRQLIPILPFLAVPMALVFRRLPVAALALVFASAAEMVAITVTRPLSSSVYGNWFDRFAAGDFSGTAIGLAGGPSHEGIALYLAGIVIAAVVAAFATARPAFAGQEAVTGLALLAGWLLVQRRGPKLLNSDVFGNGNGAFVALLFCLAVTLLAVVGPRLVFAGSANVVGRSRRQSRKE